jgi:hypothetical protein
MSDVYRNELVLALASDVDVRARRILRNLEGLEIVENSPQTVLITPGVAAPVRIRLVDASEIGGGAPVEQSDESELLVVNAVLDDDAAARLEDANASYIDASGRHWLRTWRRTKRASETAAGGKRRLYPASVRLAQLLADHPRERWTERALARRGQTTQTTAHRLLGRLEGEGLMLREGRGRTTVRRLRDTVAMRSWLSRQARPRKVTRLACFVEDPERPRKAVGRALALTGAAGAAAIGMPVLTRPATPTMRVSARPEELEDVPEALGGFRTQRGPNLILIADPDRLAFVDAVTGPDGRLVAPPSRIMLDLYLEARGEAAVDVFMSLWADREALS